MRKLLAVGLLVVLLGCSREFAPASSIDSLRLLALQVEPPELAPVNASSIVPSRATLRSLVADPAQLTDPSRRAILLHLACTPDPASPVGTACAQLETLREPTLLEAVAGEGLSTCAFDPTSADPSVRAFGEGTIGGISFSGLESCTHAGDCVPAQVRLDPSHPSAAIALPEPAYVVPRELDLDALPKQSPIRRVGVQVMLLSVLLSASVDELVEGIDPRDPCAALANIPARLSSLLAQREHVLSVKRLTVRGPDALDPPNVNPRIPGLTHRGVPLPAQLATPAQAEVRFSAGTIVDLLPLLPAPALDEAGEPLPQASVFQSFTRVDRAGQPLRTEQEQWLYSWFATAGRIGSLRTRGASELQSWLSPRGLDDEPIPKDGRVFLYTVVRDLRGGLDFTTRELRAEP